jgi:outer membrane receptor protein involved in Fe transport
LEENIYDVFAQVNLSHKTSVQTEFRYVDSEKGDLPLRFNPDDFSTTLRQKERRQSIRLGFRHAFTPYSDVIASVIYQRADSDTNILPGLDFATDGDGYMAEVQHLFRSERFHVTSGVGHFSADRKDVTNSAASPKVEETDSRHTNLYLYSQIDYPKNITWTIGGSADFFEAVVDRDQFNPKVGLTWNPFPATTLRAAVFRVLKRMLISNQTLEPTQVAGFNQFIDDPEGTESWRYGIGIDQKFLTVLYGGVEFSRRKLEVPIVDRRPGGQIREVDREEQLGRAYLHWTPHTWLVLSGEYQFERFKRPLDGTGPENIVEIQTHRLPLGISFFHPSGFSARLKATYIDQEGKFGNSQAGVVPGDDQFWTVDASIGYRLPKRWGLITVEARNLSDQRFNFQDTDPANPIIYPERLILARFTLAY